MRKRGLSHLEDLTQEMVEGTFGRLFGGRLEPLDVASQLAKAIEDNVHGGQMSMEYEVAINADDFRYLSANNPNLAESFAAAAQQLGQRAGVGGTEYPIVRIVADPDLKRRRVRISAQQNEIDQEADQNTQTYGYSYPNEDHLKLLSELDAFLIVQGRRHVPLTKHTITIGRRTENDIVLDMPSVSRQHAQLRWRYGSFVLYDISSRGTTLVNGYPSHEHALRSGDVIALGEALLVYGEGNEDILRKRIDHVDDDETLMGLNRKT